MIGKLISNYKILEKLGEGGMGVVYKAEDSKLDRVVALKFLPPHLTTSEADKARFLQEAKAASAINHPNVCVIYDIQEHEEEQFIVMEYVDGITLQQKMQADRFEVRDVIDYAIQIGEALKAAHNKNIVHRDVKSDNIMVTTTNQIKVMDFGLAKLKGSVKLTKASSTIGTLAYMAPEHLQGADVDARSDIFSFGVVLYEMLTGQLPFKGDYDSAMMYSIINEAPVPVEKFRSDLSSEFLHVLNRGLEKIPDERYQTVDDMLIDVRRLKIDSSKVHHKLPQEMPVPPKAKTVKKPKRPLWIALCAAVLLLIPGLWIINQWFFQKGTEPIVIKENSIAVMYFENNSGAEDLGNMLVKLLTTNLSRFREIEVVSSQRLYDILKMIGKEDLDVIDKSVATEVAARAPVKVMLLGDIIKFGDKFRINIQLCDVQTGSNIGSDYIEGTKFDEIFEMADQLTEKVRTMMGISVSPGSEPFKIANVTTSSVEAYNYFTKGIEAFQKFYWEDSKKYLVSAVALDTTFATAYLWLARAYYYLNDPKSRIETLKMAKKFSEKTTEKERLFIDEQYANTIEGNSEKRFKILQELIGKYPKEKEAYMRLAYYYQTRDYMKELRVLEQALEIDPNYESAINELGYTHMRMNNYEKAIDCFRKYAAIKPEDPNPIDSIGELYFRIGKLDESIVKFKDASKIKPGFSVVNIGYINALKGNYRETMDHIETYINIEPSYSRKANGYVWKGFYNYWLGKIKQSFIDFQTAKNLYQSIGNNSREAFIDLIMGWIYYDMMKLQKSRVLYEKSFGFYKKNEPENLVYNQIREHCFLALIELKTKNTKSALSRMSEVKKILPEIEKNIYRLWASFLYDGIYPEVLLTEGRLNETINLLKKTKLQVIPEMSRLNQTILYNLTWRDVLARTYIKKGELDKAISEYERIIVFDPQSNDRRLIRPVYHYRLAKLYEEKGWEGKALDEYQKFLEIWKNADENLPEKIDAQKRLANLLN